MKESNLVEVAEYATVMDIQDEPAFAWWVPYTFRKRNRSASVVAKRVKQTSHTHGIKIPCRVEEAYRFDKENGNHL